MNLAPRCESANPPAITLCKDPRIQNSLPMDTPSTNPPVATLAGRKAGVRAFHPVMIALVIAMIAGILFVSLCTPQTLGIFSSDDSYYYFLTARNIVLGKGVTFDGINATNGFHPLWMLALMPVYAVTGGDHDLSLRLIYFLLLLLFSGSIALTFNLLNASAGRIPALLTPLLFVNPVVFNLFFNGLESALVIYLLLLLLNTARRTDLVSPRMGSRNQVLAGLLLGLVFLSRLDCAFHLLGLGLVAALVYRLPVWNPKALPCLLRSYGLLLLVFALVVAPYFAWNLMANGHLTPISGTLKTSFPHAELQLCYLVAVRYAPFTLFVLFSIILSAIQSVKPTSPLRRLVATRGTGQPWAVLFVGLWLGCLLHYGYTLFFTTWGTQQWHFASYLPVALLCAGWLISRAAASSHRWVVPGLAGVVLFVSCTTLALSVVEKAKQHGNWNDAAIWARDHTPKDSVFGMTDAGYFAYFSRRTTVNLDGLINGYEYQTALASGTLDQYFAHCGINYISDYEVPASNVWFHRVILNHLFYAEQIMGKRGYDLVFPCDETVYRSHPYAPYELLTHHGSRPRIVFCIWPYKAGRLVTSSVPSSPVTL